MPVIMYMLSLSLRGGNDVGKHTHTDKWTNKQKDRINPTLNWKPSIHIIKSTMDPHKFEGSSILNIFI